MRWRLSAFDPTDSESPFDMLFNLRDISATDIWNGWHKLFELHAM
jgi:hypothetical protein